MATTPLLKTVYMQTFDEDNMASSLIYMSVIQVNTNLLSTNNKDITSYTVMVKKFNITFSQKVIHNKY